MGARAALRGGGRASRGERDALIATGHTASDQVETILYRLAASPGRRALLGMVASEGRLIRPLLGVTREQTAAYCEERGLQWREDESNDDERFARARVRSGWCRRCARCTRRRRPTCCARLRCCARRPSCSTGSSPRSSPGARSIAIARLRELPAALARMVVVRLAEEAVGTYVPQAGDRVQEILALGRRGGTRRAARRRAGGRGDRRWGAEMVKLAPRARGPRSPRAEEPPGED